MLTYLKNKFKQWMFCFSITKTGFTLSEDGIRISECADVSMKLIKDPQGNVYVPIKIVNNQLLKRHYRMQFCESACKIISESETDKIAIMSCFNDMSMTPKEVAAHVYQWARGIAKTALNHKMPMPANNGHKPIVFDPFDSRFQMVK